MNTPAKEIPAHEIVEALFDVITEEAKNNEGFARRLMSVYPETVIARTKTRKSGKKFDASQYHAVNILRNHGAAMLRGRLSSLRTKAELREVTRRSGLKLTGKALGKNATMSEIIEGVVAAAEQYIAQRGAARK